MKRLFVIFVVMTIVKISYSQWDSYFIDFESSFVIENQLVIDTVSNPDNIWQIGIPDKSVFDSAYSANHAIVTDTFNSYPINDTSSFVLKHIRPGNLGGNWSLQLNFWYQFDSDSLTDYGFIEASIDNGNTWINLLTDDNTYGLIWLEPKPVLTGNTNGWKYFSLELSQLTYTLGYSDTLLYRFTFISDENNTNKDGWILDDFRFEDIWEKVTEVNNNDNIRIYPNPSHGYLRIQIDDIEEFNYNVNIIDNTGRIIYEKNIVSSNISLNLPNGLYYVWICNGVNRYVNKIVIEK